MGDVFDPRESHRRMEEGRDRASTNARSEWKKAAKVCAWRVAESYVEFTTDDIYFELGERYPGVETPERRAMGGIMNWVVRAKVAERVPGQYIPSERVKAHRNPKQVYRSLVLK